MNTETMTNTAAETETAVREYPQITFGIESLVRSPIGASYIFKLTRLEKPHKGDMHRIDSVIRKFEAVQDAMRPASNKAQTDYADGMRALIHARREQMKDMLHLDSTEAEFEAIQRVVYRAIIGLIMSWRKGHDQHATTTPPGAA